MTTKAIHLAFLCRHDARDPWAFSGIPFHLVQALRAAGARVSLVGRQPILDTAARFTQRLGLRPWTANDGMSGARRLARFAERDLQRLRADAVLVLQSSRALAEMSTDLPLIYYSDATAALMRGYYPEPKWSDESYFLEAVRAEAKAHARAARALYTTEWAARSATREYGFDRERISIVPFAANLGDPGAVAFEEPLDPTDEIRLLFVGLDFERKGGTVVLDALAALRERGHRASLTIVGAGPHDRELPQGARCVGRLSKQDPKQLRELRELYLRSHFLLLPSRAETFGAVCGEANAFAVPAVVRDTGGLGEAVVDGINGRVLPPEAEGRRYADVVEALWKNPAAYRDLALSSRRYYETHTNWSVCAARILETIEAARRERKRA